MLENFDETTSIYSVGHNVISHIDEDRVVRKSKQVHWKSVNGEVVLMHFQSGDYFALDAVGTFLWTNICQGSASVRQLKQILVSEYDCSVEDADAGVSDLCEQLIAEHLVDLV